MEQQANEPYQVYHETQDVGKRISSSKKRLYWRFGLSQSSSLNSQRKHEVLFVHSLISGKKIIWLDGEEVHRSTSMKHEFQFQFNLRGSILQVGVSEREPYYMRIDGVQFRDLPFYSPKGVNEVMEKEGGMSPRTAFEKSQASEHEHALRVMNGLDEDLNFALRLQEEEDRSSTNAKNLVIEDERVARELQERFDREERDRQEYLRKSGVGEATINRGSDGTVEKVGKAEASAPVPAPVDLLSFDDVPTADQTGNNAASDLLFGLNVKNDQKQVQQTFDNTPFTATTVAVDVTPSSTSTNLAGSGRASNNRSSFDAFPEEDGVVGNSSSNSPIDLLGGTSFSIDSAFPPEVPLPLEPSKGRRSSKGKMPKGMKPPSGMKPPPSAVGRVEWGDKRGNLSALSSIDFHDGGGEGQASGGIMSIGTGGLRGVGGIGEIGKKRCNSSFDDINPFAGT
mmetsp:Transcript_8986/g.18154  ORF Transcript_8986/g.18154 Transcript_8986/m.18154 type:complete len:453 (+) Transcript_8986:318-1676(+)|eukprot:CAMPEP_0118651196 /NCGR_PEP_ID=MMETSP0785-20121206/10659_1 /TAXON_ID=91992 /ORGANISM="Bolidomonas pacifica, Strain CCMP 1866" /LENGTH=452 /DNA_ID=CAMNT_0006543637 /DNA_START=240 /DNA_END=1598 /DNA_ORIENTATION=+